MVTPDRIGTLIWRFKTNDGAIVYRTYQPSATDSEPHVALSLDPQKRVELREAVGAAVMHEQMRRIDDDETVDEYRARIGNAVLAVLLGSGGDR